jgi:glycosyltransferase involved in cell wall biosynthesis
MSGDGVWFLVPGRLDTPTGGFLYDRWMVRALAAAGRLAGVISLAGRFPTPGPEAAAAAATRLAALPAGATLIVDGLALVPLAELFAEHAGRLRLIALVHHPLSDETGLSPAVRDHFFAAERAALGSVAAILTTSETTKRRLQEAFVPEATPIVAIPPGAYDRRPVARRHPRDDGPVRLLAVGSLTARKGQDRLVTALAPLRRQRWRLTLVGPARDAAFARRLRLLVRRLALAHRIDITDAIPATRVARHYREAGIFALPSRHEGWGIAFVEALAHRLPVVAGRTGALPEALAAGGVRWLATAGGDPDITVSLALTRVLRPLLCREAERRRVGAEASRASRRLRSWQAAGDDFVTAIGRIITP